MSAARLAAASLLAFFGALILVPPAPVQALRETLFDSYHCSRYNTNTGVLTTAMFEDVIGRAAEASG